MQKLLITLGTLFSLFGPSVVFTIVGMRSMEKLAKRPSEAPAIMIQLGIKFVVVAVITIGLEAALLKIFAPQ